VVVEVPGEGLGQVGDLAAQLGTREVGHHRRVPFPGDQGRHHRPGGDPGDVGRDRGDLDRGVLEQLLQPVRVPGPVALQLHPVAGQVPQPADRGLGDERGGDQAVLQELGDPLRVADIGLAARDGLDVRGVEQPRRHALFQAVEHRLPVRRGRLHRRQRDPARHQPVGHHPQRPRHRGERPRLRDPPASGTGGAHADHDDLLADVQTRDPLDQHVHLDHLRALDTRAPARRGSRDRRQTRVLDGNNATHPEPPRRTLLRARPHQSHATSPDGPTILIPPTERPPGRPHHSSCISAAWTSRQLSTLGRTRGMAAPMTRPRRSRRARPV
jgi:hypothetical protein